MSAKALLSASVSAPPAVYVEDVFSTWLYTGNGSAQTITNGIDLSGEGGLVWLKGRSASNNHMLVDTARGDGNYLSSNLTNASAYNPLIFGSNGFGLSSSSLLNADFATYASWTFRKAEKFFDVVTYTGTGSARTIAHNLGSVPGCIIVKCTNSTDSWFVYHVGTGAFNALVLNSTDAAFGNNNYWNNTSPTSSVFSVGSDLRCNGSGQTYVAYLFAHDAGGFGTAGTDNVVSCGSFTYNSTSGNVVDLGWEPQFVLFKSASSSGNWYIQDTMRGMVAGPTAGARLFPNLSNAEDTGFVVGPYATGFNVKSGFFTNSDTIIYIAIRRGPMKTPTVGTEVFKVNTRTGTGSNTSVTGIGFTPDLVAAKVRTTADLNWGTYWYDRLRGNFKRLASSSVSDEGGVSSGYALAGTAQETADIVQIASINTSGDTLVDWFFRRAPGFFDVVAYTGTSSATTVSHNLGVAPELMIVKSRSRAGENWVVYHNGMGAMDVAYIFLNQNFAKAVYGAYDGYFSSTAPSSSVFSLGTDAAVNFNTATYIAYLFATAPGVSKVGSYTGTGTTLNVDCGFTAGARFVLIKRTDSTGDWYVWDTARGIISGNDPYLLLNSTAAEVTNTDYIDPLSSGFQISSTAPAAINASGGTYIFLSIA
jgi:hypothetical protein